MSDEAEILSPPPSTSYASLADALAAHAIALPPEQLAKLDAYRALLWEWNEKLNLTRHTNYETFVIRDVVDSLELAKLIPAQAKVLDVGTGGGVPGVIIAITRPELHVELCESVAKRAKVVAEIVAALELNIVVYNARAEDLLGDAQFDVVVARAVAPLAKMLAWFEGCWPAIGELLLIKGMRWTNERGEARHRGMLKPLELRVAATYITPVTGAENVILRIWPKAKTASVG